MTTFLALGIFALTLLGVLMRPRGIGEAWFAAGGGAAALALGLVSFREAGEILRQSGAVLLFLLFLMALSALVDTSGFFDWAATLAARTARGNARHLLVGVFLLGAAVTILLSLDTTALLLTPLVWAIAARAKLPPKPYAFACAFVANIASSALPVSNLTNLLVFNRLGVTTGRYALLMIPVTVLASLTALGVLLWRFRRDLPAEYDADAFPDPLDAVPDLPYFRVTLIVLGITLLGYFVGPAFLKAPLWTIAATGAVLLATVGRILGRVRLRTLATRGIAWSVFPFVVGMFLVIRGVENIGLAKAMGDGIRVVGGASSGGQLFAAAFGAAAGANLINNIPMQLLCVSAFPAGGPSLYGSLLGCNLGPNITIVGSLATMLWRTVLQKRGLDISPKELAGIGLLVTLPALTVAALTLWVMVQAMGIR